MHICFKLLIKTVWQSLFIKPFRPLRVLAMLLGVAVFVVFELFLSLCLALDHLFFPGFRRTPVRFPVFIIGNPRSGTSHLFRLMALDEERFTSFKFHELLFPAITQQFCLSMLRRLDPYLGHPFRRLRERVEARYMAPRDAIHRTRFNEPEEDDFLSMHKFASPLLLAMFERSKALSALVRFDELPAPFRRNVMGFYKACLKRNLYWAGKGRTLLSKNPTFSTKIRSIREVFPDARFVYILRNPSVSFASMYSLFVTARSRYGAVKATTEQVRRLYETGCYMYQIAFEQLERLSNTDYCIVNYEQLVSDPQGLIHRIYDTLGLSRSAAFEQRLCDATNEAKRYRSRHQYSLDPVRCDTGRSPIGAPFHLRLLPV